MPWSSDELIKAVERHGFSKKGGHGPKGTHRVWARSGKPGELHNTVTIPLGKKRIPDGTLASILRNLGLDAAALETWRKKPGKGAKKPKAKAKATKKP